MALFNSFLNCALQAFSNINVCKKANSFFIRLQVNIFALPSEVDGFRRK
jgi:hypothetical protein